MALDGRGRAPHAATGLQQRASTRLLAFRAPGRSRAIGRCRSAAAQESASAAVQLEAFKDGTPFSPIINGTWQLAGGHGRAIFDQTFDKLRAWAEAGLTSYDSADIYGASEPILGELHKRWLADGNPPLQLFTKYVPNLNHGPPNASAVRSAVQRSLHALQAQRLDLVQLHWWDYGTPGLLDTLRWLADLQAEGLVRSLGLTNIDCEHAERITDAGIPIVSNQVQLSLLDRRALGPNGMLQLCSERGIRLLCYGVVGGGLLSDRYLERGDSRLQGPNSTRRLELDTSSLKMYYNVLREFGGEDAWRRLLHTLREVADKHSTAVSSVAVRWVMQQGDGGTAFPIIGVRSTRHIQTNLSALSLMLDEDDMAYIDEMLRRHPGPRGDIYSFERAR